MLSWLQKETYPIAITFRLLVSNQMKEALLKCLQQAYARGHLRLTKRIHALLFILDGKPVAEVARILDSSKQSVYNYLKAFLLKKLESLKYTHLPGCPRKLTKTQRKKLRKLIDDGPEVAGYDCGCWSTGLIQDLILRGFKVAYTPHMWRNCPRISVIRTNEVVLCRTTLTMWLRSKQNV